MRDINVATSQAIAFAKRRGATEVSRDDVLLGCLYAASRFGIAKLGPWTFDLEAYGLDWKAPLEKSGAKVAYSDEVVAIFDQAARIARADGSGVTLVHLLVAFADEESGLMGKLKSEFHFKSAGWRAAAAELGSVAREPIAASADATPRDYLTPEEAAAALDIHVQTLRAYVRAGKLPALRLAGERAIRIRRADLASVLEPFSTEK